MNKHQNFKNQQQNFKNQPVCVLRVNIHCDGCEKKVRKALKKIEGVEASYIDAEQGKVTVSGYVHPNTIIKKLEKSGKQAELWGPTMKSFGQNNFKKNQVSDIEFGDFDGGMKKMKPQQKGGKGFKDMSVNLAPKAPKSVKFEFGESDGEFGDESDGFEVDFGRRPPPRTPGRGGGGKSGVVVKKAKKGGIFRVLLRRLLGKSKGKGGKGGKKAATSGGGHGGGKGKSGKNGDKNWMMESGKNGGKNMSMVVAKNGGNNGGKKGKNLDFEIDVGNPKKGARGGGGGGGGYGGYGHEGGGGVANGHHKGGGGGGGGYDGQGRANSGGNMYGVGGHGGDSAFQGGSYGGGRFAGQMGQMGHAGQMGNPAGQMGNPQMMGNHQMGPTSTHQMGQMGHSMGQMGTHQVPQMGHHSMGQMGTHQMPQMGHHSMGQMGLAPIMTNGGGGGGYYQGMSAPANPYNQQYMAMMMNQQRMQGNNGMYHPLMYERRPNPMASYDPPRPSGGYTHMFSDENTESCSIM